MAMDLHSGIAQKLSSEQTVHGKISKDKTSAHHWDISRPPVLLDMPARKMKAHILGKIVHQSFNFLKKNLCFCQTLIKVEKDI